jgi:hypothetical protein
LGPKEYRLRFFKYDGQTVIDISDFSGMGKATVKRKRPVPTVVRLHLGGLESFRVGTGQVHMEWWGSSGGDNRTRIALSQSKGEVEIDRTSPYCTKLRIVGGNGKVPLSTMITRWIGGRWLRTRGKDDASFNAGTTTVARDSGP